MQILRLLARTAILLGTLFAALVGAMVMPASAHATFLGAPTVAAGDDVRLALDVPHERDESIHNVEVRIQVPSGWSPVSCEPFATWTCSISGAVIGFVKETGADPAQDETFIFVVHASATGPALFPVQQVYSSGEDVLWADTARLTAGPPTTAPPTTVEPSGPTTPSDSVLSTEDRGIVSEPPVVGVAGPDAPDGPASEDPVSPADAGAGSAIAGQEGATDESSGASSSSALPVVIAVVALVALGSGAILVVRRRRVGA